MQPAPPDISGIELSKSQRKTLASIGHHVTRFAAACEKIRTHAEKFPDIQPWLTTGQGTHESVLVSPGAFACLMTLDGTALFFTPNPKEANAVVPFRNSPVWAALLRLRPLREFWERELRRNTFEALLSLCPDAWLLDPSPLPPGAVIPRLEIPSWDEFDPAKYETRHFIPGTAAEIRAHLSSFPDSPGALMSFPRASPAAQNFISQYQNDNGRVDWTGVTLLKS